MSLAGFVLVCASFNATEERLLRRISPRILLLRKWKGWMAFFVFEAVLPPFFTSKHPTSGLLLHRAIRTFAHVIHLKFTWLTL